MQHYGPITFAEKIVMQHNTIILMFPTGDYRAFPIEGSIKGVKWRGHRPIAGFFTEPNSKIALENVAKSMHFCLHPIESTTAMLEPGDVIHVHTADWGDKQHLTWEVVRPTKFIDNLRIMSGTNTVKTSSLRVPTPTYYCPDGLDIPGELI